MPSSAGKILLAFTLLTVPAAVQASSDQAWAEFAAEVEQKCGEAASEIFRRHQVVVDPNGTESFGVALVFGGLRGGKGRAAVICVMDKKTGAIELGTELGPDMVRVRPPKPEGDDTNRRANSRPQKNADQQGTNDERMDDGSQLDTQDDGSQMDMQNDQQQ